MSAVESFVPRLQAVEVMMESGIFTLESWLLVVCIESVKLCAPFLPSAQWVNLYLKELLV